MTEPDPTGYDESLAAPDGPLTPGVEREEVDEGGAELTTDDDAQRDDSPERPGNEPD
jgi:hypothetical protein